MAPTQPRLPVEQDSEGVYDISVEEFEWRPAKKPTQSRSGDAEPSDTQPERPGANPAHPPDAQN